MAESAYKGLGQLRPLVCAAIAFAIPQAAFLLSGKINYALAAAAIFAAAGLALAIFKSTRGISVFLAIAVLASLLSARQIFAENRLIDATSEGDASCQMVVTDRNERYITARLVSVNGTSGCGLTVRFRCDEAVIPGDCITTRTYFREQTYIKGNTLQGIKRAAIISVDREVAPLHWLYRAKQRLSSELLMLIPGDEGELCSSVLTGDTSVISRELKSSIAAAGLGDILAVSGMHVSLVLTLFAAPFKRKRYLRLGISAVLSLFLAFFYSFTPSVVRAAIMQILSAVAISLYRRADGLNSLGFAVLVMTAIEPRVMFELSFLMSVSCCLGIFLLYQPIERALEQGEDEEKLQKFGKLVLNFFKKNILYSIIVSVCVSIALLPCYYISGMKLSLCGAFTTLITSPVMLPQLILSAAAAVFQMVSPFSLGARLAALLAALCSRWIIIVARFFGRLSFLQLDVARPWTLFFIAFLFFCLWLCYTKRLKIWVCAAACTAFLCIGIASDLLYTSSLVTLREQYGFVFISQRGTDIVAACENADFAAAYSDGFMNGADYVIISKTDDSARLWLPYLAGAQVYYFEDGGMILLPNGVQLWVAESPYLSFGSEKFTIIENNAPNGEISAAGKLYFDPSNG